ncbi:hypothetical protein OAD22_05885 [Pseudomonadales bacterium]|nr:hypothetical protein [Pseudomonadales bacterium]MDA9064124.1 hypothetical protein [Pseudomonadales bacterium]MDB9868292.1 hypothetical protein [Pseudomonadales bacterium]MDB9879131.1 hypothetical protein [Pseudomonadales bacterium]MDB9917277.1 hypothetical protein [Pseudomonadales bacterium]|tara:strand:+ start:1636 stop:1818 length:183 start_codon:yes stop_codon:yes gene_type:complete
MSLDQLIIFLVFGFFVFVAEVDSWWAGDSIFSWYVNYLPWLGLIVLCIWAQLVVKRKSGD